MFVILFSYHMKSRQYYLNVLGTQFAINWSSINKFHPIGKNDRICESKWSQRLVNVRILKFSSSVFSQNIES